MYVIMAPLLILVRFSVSPSVKKALLAVQVEESTAAPGLPHPAFDPRGADSDADKHEQGDDRVAEGIAANLEEDPLQDA